ATLLGETHRPTAEALAAAGWEAEEIVVMAARPGGSRVAGVEQVDAEALRPVWAATWRRDVPGVSDAAVTDLVDRNLLQEEVVDARYLAVRAEGAVVASGILLLDGATAWLTDLATDPAHRGRGHGDA